MDRTMTYHYRRIAMLVFVAALLLRLAFVFLTPAWQSPDEYAHYWVTEQIALTGAHPVSDHTWPNYESYQPPLYYWIASPVVSAFDLPVSFSLQPTAPPAPLIALRILSILIFAATFWLTVSLLRRFDQMESNESLWCLAFVGFLPTYVATGASVSNDGLVILLSVACSAVIWNPVWTGRTAFYGGFLAGLALLAKWNAVVLIPLVIWRVWRMADGDRRRAFRYLGLAAAGWLLPALLLVGRNLIQYSDPVALNPGTVKGLGFTLGNLLRAVRNLTWSFWLAFGADYRTTPAPVVYVVTAFPLMLAALAGWWRSFRERADLGRTSFVAVALGIAGSLAYTLSYPPGEMTSWGKNLFVVLPFVAILAAVGWTQFYRRVAWLIPSIAMLLMLTGCGWGLWQLSRMTIR